MIKANSSEQSLKIRNATQNDFKILTEIWLKTSIKAHHFISKTYWEQNKSNMQELYLPMAEVYLIENNQNIHGFIALAENKIAALFVLPEQQGKGLGLKLLNYVKEIRTQLELNVYQDNKKSVDFYQKHGFSIEKETIDENTNAQEFVMYWQK